MSGGLSTAFRSRRPAVAFVYEYFGPYMVDRCAAAADRLRDRWDVLGVEISASNHTYAWAPSGVGPAFEKVTLFESVAAEDVPVLECFRRLTTTLRGARVRHVFIVNYNYPYSLLTALACRALGIRAWLCMESTFEDRPRKLWREALKTLWAAPYRGCLAGGPAHADYARFLGLSSDRIVVGYDCVSIERIRRLAEAPPAPAGVAFEARGFTIVARFVEKKNLPMAIEAYGRYRAMAAEAGGTPRPLTVIGDGAERPAIEAAARLFSGDGVVFRGFLQEAGVARTLASTLALILPSTEEQWGLVVNEAVAMGVPILCSDRVGARSLLVKTGRNGFVFSPDDVEALARLMFEVARDRERWRAMARASLELADRGDVARFAAGVETLIGLNP